MIQNNPLPFALRLTVLSCFATLGTVYILYSSHTSLALTTMRGVTYLMFKWGDVPEWLTGRFAKPYFVSSILTVTSKIKKTTSLSVGGLFYFGGDGENRRDFLARSRCLNGIFEWAGGLDGRLRKNPDDDAARWMRARRRILTSSHTHSLTKHGPTHRGIIRDAH